MKRYTLTLLQAGLLFLGACENSNPKPTIYNEKRELVPNPEGYKKDTFAMEDDSPAENRWHFKKYLDDPATPRLAKDIFHNNWELKSEYEETLLSFPEKLTSNNKQERPFYFKVVTNLSQKDDGALSEALDLAGHDYVQNNTKEFTAYFAGPGAFSNKDLETWAGIVIGELAISGENEQGQYDKNLANQYISSLYNNCADCKAEQKKVIDRFGAYLKKQWTKFLKSNEKSE
jgi:hypothetical protein